MKYVTKDERLDKLCKFYDEPSKHIALGHGGGHSGKIQVQCQGAYN